MKPNQNGVRLAMLLSLITCSSLQAAAPVVSNVRAAQRPGTPLVDIYYNLADADSATLTVAVAVSTNAGASYSGAASSFTGALGSSVTPGSNQKITWNAGVDLPAKLFSNVRVSVTASDDTAPGGMALIPAGSFEMGDTLSDNTGTDEQPVHTVYVSAFYMDRYEVTKALWDEVYNWAITHGYSFEYGAQGKAANHPAQSMTWYDAVKWCNARSEKDGRTPAYYTSAAQTTVYRSGQVTVDNSSVKWNGGYRLPTEAEWEKAARGGAAGQRFPWGNTITHSQANYYSSSSYAYDTSPTQGYHPTFSGVSPYTSPVGYFAANGYGLYDMAGNVWEWCWDWDGSYPSGSQTDPRGPTLGSLLVSRGGSWLHDATHCRAAIRALAFPANRNDNMGFRSVLPPVDLPAITVQPRGRSVRPGSTVTFSVTATGAAPLSYQWRLNGADIPSATGASLILTNVQSSGYYSVVVSNELGIVTSQTAQLRVSSIGEF